LEYFDVVLYDISYAADQCILFDINYQSMQFPAMIYQFSPVNNPLSCSRKQHKDSPAEKHQVMSLIGRCENIPTFIAHSNWFHEAKLNQRHLLATALGVQQPSTVTAVMFPCRDAKASSTVLTGIAIKPLWFFGNHVKQSP
jgi:hypothetical protein